MFCVTGDTPFYKKCRSQFHENFVKIVFIVRFRASVFRYNKQHITLTQVEIDSLQEHHRTILVRKGALC